jgi:hypothetical protein
MSEDRNSSSNPLLVILAATVLVVLAIGTYVYLGNKPPVHSGQVVSVNIYPIHRETQAGASTEGIGGGTEVYDQLLVLANVKIKNQTDIPLFLHDMSAVLNLPNDETIRSTGAGTTDFQKVFIAYPDLASQKKDPLRRDTTLAPGQEIEGQLIFNYSINKAQWDARTGIDLYFEFLYQKELVLHVPK